MAGTTAAPSLSPPPTDNPVSKKRGRPKITSSSHASAIDPSSISLSTHSTRSKKITSAHSSVLISDLLDDGLDANQKSIKTIYNIRSSDITRFNKLSWMKCSDKVIDRFSPPNYCGSSYVPKLFRSNAARIREFRIMSKRDRADLIVAERNWAIVFHWRFP